MRWRYALLSHLKIWLARPLPPGGWDATALRATPPLCIIGDLHGRMDLLEQMLTRIVAQTGSGPVRRIFVGDMIDRGPDSLDVLRHLYRLNLQDPDTTICLMGNHERMMLDFLDAPDRHGPRWIAAGGAETLASAGIGPWRRAPMTGLADQLRTALGHDILDWLQGLPLYWQTSGIGVTHAGAAPELDLANQSDTRLLWGARGMPTRPRSDGMWIAQGHDTVTRAWLADGRIMVDTGAWRSGLLSAVWIDTQGARIIEIQQNEKTPDPVPFN